MNTSDTLSSLSRNVSISLMLFVSAVLCSCGVDTTTSDATSSPSLSSNTPIIKCRVGYMPIVECAHLYVGIAKKFFAQEGIETELKPMRGGAIILPALQNDDIDIGFANVVSLIALNSKMPPCVPNSFVCLAGASYERPRHVNHSLLYKQGANVTVSDLGTPRIRIGVNTYRNIEELMLRRYLHARGVSDKQLTLVPLGFPDMLSALDRGDVDVASVVEPYIEPALRSGKFLCLENQYLAVSTNTLVATYAVTRKWLDNNKDCASRFKRCFSKANEFIKHNDAETRKILSEFTRIKEADLAVIGLPAFEPNIDGQSVAELTSEMRKYGFIDKEPNPTDIVTPLSEH